jgi:hypothetical protein
MTFSSPADNYTNGLGGGDEVVCRVDAVTQIITTVAGRDTNPTHATANYIAAEEPRH